MTPLYLDLTVAPQEPPAWLVRDQSQFTAPANYKDPAKIAEYIQHQHDAQEDRMRAASASMPDGPLFGGTISSVRVAVGDAAPVALRSETDDETGELALLLTLQRALARRDVGAHRLVTYGPHARTFAAKRAMRHGLWALARWVHSAEHVDLHRLWTGGDRSTRGRLEEVARYLGVVVDAGEWDEPTSVDLIRGVHLRMAAAGLTEGDQTEGLTVREADEPTKPAPLIPQTGTRDPSLPVLEEHMALYSRAIAAGLRFSNPPHHDWRTAAYRYLGARLDTEVELWTGTRPPPEDLEGKTESQRLEVMAAWHDEQREVLRTARLACMTGEWAWVMPTPIPTHADCTILLDGDHAALSGVAVGPDKDAAVKGRVIVPPARGEA